MEETRDAYRILVRNMERAQRTVLMIDFRNVSLHSGSGSDCFSGVTFGSSGSYVWFLLMVGWFSLSH